MAVNTEGPQETRLKIQLENASLVSNGVVRLKGISWTVPEGVTAVLGQSGAGKTSLLDLLIGHDHNWGKGTVPSVSITSFAELGMGHYWVPQSGGLWSHWTVRQHVRNVLPDFKDRRDSEEKADELLGQFDLQHRQATFPDELSMGEKSRLSIARALAVAPFLLVMDEPLAHVDGHRRNKYWQVIHEHVKRTEAVLVFSTHEPSDAVAWSEHIVCLEDGRLVHNGLTAELYHHPPTEQAGRFLGPLNWFEPSETSAWLQEQSASPIAARPQAVVCVADKTSPLKLLSSVWYGAYSESVVEDVRSGETRTIFHRPFANREAAPENVRLEVTL